MAMTQSSPDRGSITLGARERLKASACARFTTVLGPASDGFHENHVHVDLAERRAVTPNATRTLPERPAA